MGDSFIVTYFWDLCGFFGIFMVKLWRKRGRVVEGARLEIVWAAKSRRFESSRFRHMLKKGGMMSETLRNNSGADVAQSGEFQPFDAENVQKYREWSAFLRENGIDEIPAYESGVEYHSIKAEEADDSVTEKVDARLSESCDDLEEQYKDALRKYEEDDPKLLDAKAQLDYTKGLKSAFLAALSAMGGDQMREISFDSVAQLLALKKLQQSRELHDKGADNTLVEEQLKAINDVSNFWCNVKNGKQ